MKPLAITARLDPLGAPLSLPDGYVHLDGLLAWAVILRDGLPVATNESELRPIAIPVEMEPGGRFHLCSASAPTWEQMERRFINRRFPLEEAAVRTDMKRVMIGAGPSKSYRIPLEAGRVRGDSLTWYAIAEEVELRELLPLIVGIGKKRATGGGRVAAWEVKEVEPEPWPGFPVLAPDGAALRHLPADWPGLAPDAVLREGRLTFPYWLHANEVMVTVPAC